MVCRATPQPCPRVPLLMAVGIAAATCLSAVHHFDRDTAFLCMFGAASHAVAPSPAVPVAVPAVPRTPTPPQPTHALTARLRAPGPHFTAAAPLVRGGGQAGTQTGTERGWRAVGVLLMALGAALLWTNPRWPTRPSRTERVLPMDLWVSVASAHASDAVAVTAAQRLWADRPPSAPSGGHSSPRPPMAAASVAEEDDALPIGRRQGASLIMGALVGAALRSEAACADGMPVGSSLNTILRAQGAVQQELGWVEAGKCPAIMARRANVKVFVQTLLFNFRIERAFRNAGLYLYDDPDRWARANEAGQSATAALRDILTDFDTVSDAAASIGGLDGAQKTAVAVNLQVVSDKIDDFLAFFPTSTVQAVQAAIAQDASVQECPCV